MTFLSSTTTQQLLFFHVCTMPSYLQLHFYFFLCLDCLKIIFSIVYNGYILKSRSAGVKIEKSGAEMSRVFNAIRRGPKNH